MSFERQDVIWSDDPFKDDPGAGRPWLVVNNDGHPFGDEQVMALALTTSGYEQALPIPEDAWLEGGTPRRSYVLPWAVHSPRNDDVVRTQGRLAAGFVSSAVSELVDYVRETA